MRTSIDAFQKISPDGIEIIPEQLYQISRMMGDKFTQFLSTIEIDSELNEVTKEFGLFIQCVQKFCVQQDRKMKSMYFGA